MNRNSYLRIIRHDLPPNTSAESLEILSLVSQPSLVVEGFLLEDVRLNAPIRFRSCFQGGKPHYRSYISSEVVRIDGQYILTRHTLFQFLRVPPITPFDGELQTEMTNVDELLFPSVKSSSISHSKTTLYWAHAYSLPQHLSYPDLSVLASLGYSFAQFKGYLRRRPVVGRALRFLDAPAGSGTSRLLHMSAPIVRQEGEYFLTEHSLYRVTAI